MQNINLRKFKNKDLKAIGECMKHKIIPVVCGISLNNKEILQDYIERDMENELALVVIDGKTDVMLGALDSILIGDVFLTSYYVLPEYQNKGICTESLRLFIEYIRRNNPDVRQIVLKINLLNFASQKVAKKNEFKIVSKNEFAQYWMYNL